MGPLYLDELPITIKNLKRPTLGFRLRLAPGFAATLGIPTFLAPHMFAFVCAVGYVVDFDSELATHWLPTHQTFHPQTSVLALHFWTVYRLARP